MIHKKITYYIRIFIDEWLPPIIRNNKYFMYPLFYFWYKGKNVNKIMHFKEKVESMDEAQYIKIYEEFDSIISGKTDINESTLKFISNNLPEDKNIKILDVGCGNGFLLEVLSKRGYQNILGCDIVNELKSQFYPFKKGEITKLPFNDNEFDIVITSHVLEHIVDINMAVKELKRVANKAIIVIVPCQKYNRFTFDLHVNFYPQRRDIINAIGLKKYKCELHGGAWSYIGIIK